MMTLWWILNPLQWPCKETVLGIKLITSRHYVIRWLETNPFVDSCTSRRRSVIEPFIHNSSTSQQTLVIPSPDSFLLSFNVQCPILTDQFLYYFIREKSKLIHSLEYARRYYPRRKKHEHDQVSSLISWAREVPASPPWTLQQKQKGNWNEPFVRAVHRNAGVPLSLEEKAFNSMGVWAYRDVLVRFP